MTIADKITIVSIFFGIILSGYAIYVEYQASMNEEFEALCDFSEQVSCSKVFLSEYGKIFSKLGLVPKDSALDLPNACFGLLFYLFYFLIYSFSRVVPYSNLLLLSMSVFSLVFSAYLAWILATVLHEFCVVCTSTYACNFGLFVASAMSSKKSEKITGSTTESKSGKKKKN